MNTDAYPGNVYYELLIYILIKYALTISFDITQLEAKAQAEIKKILLLNRKILKETDPVKRMPYINELVDILGMQDIAESEDKPKFPTLFDITAHRLTAKKFNKIKEKLIKGQIIDQNTKTRATEFFKANADNRPFYAAKNYTKLKGNKPLSKICTGCLVKFIPLKQIQQRNNDTISPLHIASAFGNTKFLERLLVNHAINQLDVRDETGIHYACRYGNAEALHYLYDKGLTLDRIAAQAIDIFLMACCSGSCECAKKILEAKPDLFEDDPYYVKIDTPIKIAVDLKSRELFKLLMQFIPRKVFTKNTEGINKLYEIGEQIDLIKDAELKKEFQEEFKAAIDPQISKIFDRADQKIKKATIVSIIITNLIILVCAFGFALAAYGPDFYLSDAIVVPFIISTITGLMCSGVAWQITKSLVSKSEIRKWVIANDLQNVEEPDLEKQPLLNKRSVGNTYSAIISDLPFQKEAGTEQVNGRYSQLLYNTKYTSFVTEVEQTKVGNEEDEEIIPVIAEEELQKQALQLKK